MNTYLDRLGSAFMTVGSVIFGLALNDAVDIHWAAAVGIFGLGVACLYAADRRKKSLRRQQSRANGLSQKEARR